ncbi:helix-turn-helix transcriptional regulator [Allosediminivita pacifica]|uniref:Regulatory LuxR family protein n=1 Tax=Allosediminivita pacifica TaxID=1267769 RepID=A0A2T6AQF0_9RHOB|nr:helix-turn-helix transcriptional regulator [Allosediminivita pacifica]PTX46054.1 regulatory LuxR family protein [Allosediminivita pacifica]GGB18690.1 hypothetical protein GCM10011324_31050 [Allosediminivita pacifica]
MLERFTTRMQMRCLLFCVLMIGAVQVANILERPNVAPAWLLVDLSMLPLIALCGLMGLLVYRRQSRARDQRAELEARLSAASGDIAGLLERRFADWRLSRTEREVALLIIKGFSNCEIAELRGTRPATTKCQTSAIFRKSGLSNRQQLASMLLEDVVDRMSEAEPGRQGATP